MPKRKRGRPPKPMPEPIPDAPENVVRAVLRTRSKAERDQINQPPPPEPG